MLKTYKALSLLLSYPSEELKNAAPALRAALQEEALLSRRALAGVDALLGEFEALDLYELQERYVFLFDRTRSLSLHLFEHVHGESRDRGQAMVDLKSLYAAAGLDARANELPDFLPLFLEYLSTRDAREGSELLAEPLSVIAALRERLDKRGSAYAAIFRALESLAAAAPKDAALAELRRAADDDPNDLAALDAAWVEEPVTFGPGEPSCPTARSLVERMQKSPPPSARS
jgi:nitrate reductase delta subunit